MTSEYDLHLQRVADRKRRLRTELEETLGAAGEISLEIGCGHGHWLVDYAAANPDRRCLGIDIVRDRVERARRKQARAGQENLSFLLGEAAEVLDQLPQGIVLAEVFLLFSDPWPKKRHWKNRVFNARFLQDLGRRCFGGARLHFRTDHPGYFAWAEEVVAEQELWKVDSSIPWPLERETVFQARAESYQSMILVKQKLNFS